ncbi:ribosomal protein S18-alanine N-acetyltransferase [Salinicoccus halitifaciens]|uniref:[Ribosomal protein bS18]-alanine N-acetyltransferase n=1 Tax=Salinicoccus halitifaciens TaxID=1073415 RepID=A0ABV2EE05_9STAP|nr:ribosomal protein S18-alanine N-acetyltransferase [Salinicoccus halitifaciens]MCD2137318.1 ribosomal protein S18-alanine N-acetyltransferase [Salinicoccus halitifaciens]
MDGKESVTIRPMGIEDIDAVHMIETASFTKSSWTKEAFLREVAANKFAHYFVMEKDSEIIGYCGLWLILDQSQITTIAIREDQRGHGFGHQLLQFIKEYSAESTTTLSLEVNVDNDSAKSLYEKEGFSYGGIRKDYYGPGEDAHVMWVKLDE